MDRVYPSSAALVTGRQKRRKPPYLRKQLTDAEAILQELQQAYEQSVREGELLRAKLAILPLGFAVADESFGVRPTWFSPDCK